MALSVVDDRLLTRREVAEILGLREQTLARWRWAGRKDGPPELKFGRLVRTRASDLAQWIAERGEGSSSAAKAGRR
jgi:predicted DNA-binding transcriptional regulator AlpA